MQTGVQAETGLTIEHVSKTYHDGRRSIDALSAIDVHVQKCEFVTLIGPSGCGKSTLFNLIASIEDPDSGSIEVNGQARGRRAGLFGYMPQQPLLLPWRTVEENVLLGLDVRKVARQESQRRASKLLKQFGLAEFAQSYPAALSGGMKQRVAL